MRRRKQHAILTGQPPHQAEPTMPVWPATHTRFPLSE
jgi:hypothetical protein